MVKKVKQTYKQRMQNKMSKSGTKTAYQTIKTENESKVYNAREQAKLDKIQKANEKRAFKNETRRLKAEGRRNGNWFQRKMQRKIDLADKKNEVAMRELDARAKNKELDPELRKLEAETNANVKVERAKAAGKTAAYTTVGAAVSNLGRGLIDEQNRDDAKSAKALKDNLETIFGSGSSNSKETTTDGDLTEGVV